MAPHKESSPLKCSYISCNFDLIQGVRLFLELARKFGLITMMKYQNFEKNSKNSAKNKKWNYSSL